MERSKDGANADTASDHIKDLQSHAAAGETQMQSASKEFEKMRLDMEALRNENYHLAQEMQHYREQARPSTATTMHPQPHYAPPAAPMMVDPSRSLPPLTNGVPAGSSMQGVQYSEERRVPT